jgi:hypothetical protein
MKRSELHNSQANRKITGAGPTTLQAPTPSRARKVTTLDTPTKDKVMDTETKKMVQYVSSTVNLARGKRYRCWWCTLSIEDEPIGCPINVLHEQGQKTYSTDGVFCSFNCVKAYINDKERLDVMYKNSHVLLGHMVCDMNGSISPVSVEPAPDKRLLTDYGGYMTKEQYRHCFSRMLYTEKGVIKMYPTTSIFQEEEKINRGTPSKR